MGHTSRRCTWASAAWPRTPRRTSPGWPSKRAARTAAGSFLARRWAGLAPIDDADGCFVVGAVNQQALFRRVAAVVHHGGAGTTTTAGRAGAPQVVVPRIADQPYWAARVAELGIGVAHEGSTPTVDSLSVALTMALAPRPEREPGPWPARSEPTGRQWPRNLLLDAASRESRS
jgi:vancomycin aglycone glucosyltransferase